MCSMDAKANKRNRMSILKRKRESRNLPSIATRRLSQNTQTTVLSRPIIASENSNPNYTSPFENSFTKIGSSSGEPIPANRTPFTPITYSVGTQVGTFKSLITTVSQTSAAQTVNREDVSIRTMEQVTTVRAHRSKSCPFII